MTNDLKTLITLLIALGSSAVVGQIVGNFTGLRPLSQSLLIIGVVAVGWGLLWLGIMTILHVGEKKDN